MTWFKSFDTLDFILISIFIVFYILFIYKTLSKAKKLHTTANRVLAKLILRSLYFALFIIALLGPSFGKKTQEVETIGKDIYIAIDLSNSMNAHDIQPTRLEKIKFELKNIVESFKGDRIGLIIFSSEAFVQCPLTYDIGALNLFISTLNSSLVPKAGTDFEPPLSLALQKLTNDNSPSEENNAKVIVLISDGEDFGEQSKSTAEEISENGIKIFTLGVGSEEGSKIKQTRGYLTDKQGKNVVTKLNPVELKEIARIGNGNYFEINSSRSDVTKLINSIKSIKGKSRGKTKLEVSNNKYTYFLILAFILMVVDVMIPVQTIKLQ
ncbi:vWA domain-containing protein [Aureibacter tunicatorum]|uniref:Ca-activated chloride channel family protein n=1 Tax=Aureibacter tunicatorum TaxID=866807 RepID=A0AAE3XPF2_9BACT|nr:VWA domain-containing protein [Aureibacter tunicatorum]MDR6239624.1 Ca-activated chloride channel family protein [Aureibacter tunicatorum]BDD04101.1 aerotolerance regulator BatB [Aureibacter tunicatorum]